MDEWKLTSIADVAPTLDNLKISSLEKQAALLLRRIATVYRNEFIWKNDL